MYSLRLRSRHDFARLTPRRTHRRSRTTTSRIRRNCPHARRLGNRPPQLQPKPRRKNRISSSNREAQRKKVRHRFFRQATDHSRRPYQLSPRGPTRLQERPEIDRQGSDTPRRIRIATIGDRPATEHCGFSWSRGSSLALQRLWIAAARLAGLRAGPGARVLPRNGGIVLADGCPHCGEAVRQVCPLPSDLHVAATPCGTIRRASNDPARSQ